MEEDPNQGQQNNSNRRGGGGGLLKFLPIILLFVFKRPKLLIPILIIGGIWYFFFGGSSMLSGGAQVDPNFGLGAQFDQQKYDGTEVFEPLAYGRSGIPSSYSLLKYAPKRLNQGEQGSCVGWASAYAARTILLAQATGQNPDAQPFSPSFLYNHIARNRSCQGSYLPDAMGFMKSVGALPIQSFPYDPYSCVLRANDAQAKEASKFQVRGYQRLTEGGSNYKPDVKAIRQYIAKGGPVVIGMEVGGSFMRQMEGKKLWRPTRSDYGRYGFGGHAMCVIGYDDNYSGGAFQIMNSWGPEWGQNGVAWVTYNDFYEFVIEAYGLYPMGKNIQQNKDRLAVEFGLVQDESFRSIPLRLVSNNFFRTLEPIQKGTRFKIEVGNSAECYTYVFGQETDGSSYVLFPYTGKHSAYCGITGVRVFPKDYNMVPDEHGSSDLMAVVVSKRQLDYNQLNQAINRASGNNYGEKLNNALRNRLIPRVQYKGGNKISFDGKIGGGRDAIAIVIAVDKK